MHDLNINDLPLLLNTSKCDFPKSNKLISSLCSISVSIQTWVVPKTEVHDHKTILTTFMLHSIKRRLISILTVMRMSLYITNLPELTSTIKTSWTN